MIHILIWLKDYYIIIIIKKYIQQNFHIKLFIFPLRTNRSNSHQRNFTSITKCIFSNLHRLTLYRNFNKISTLFILFCIISIDQSLGSIFDIDLPSNATHIWRDRGQGWAILHVSLVRLWNMKKTAFSIIFDFCPTGRWSRARQRISGLYLNRR